MKHPVDAHVGKRIRHRRWMVGMTQQQWIEMLDRIEVCAGTAAAHTQTALGVSRTLSRASTPGVKLLKPGE